MQSMRAHLKQSTNRKISGNVSVTPGKSYKIPPPVYLTENSLMSSLFNVVIDTQRQIYMYKIVTVKADAEEIVTFKCIWHQICTKSLL